MGGKESNVEMEEAECEKWVNVEKKKKRKNGKEGKEGKGREGKDKDRK